MIGDARSAIYFILFLNIFFNDNNSFKLQNTRTFLSDLAGAVFSAG